MTMKRIQRLQLKVIISRIPGAWVRFKKTGDVWIGSSNNDVNSFMVLQNLVERHGFVCVRVGAWRIWKVI